LEQNAAEIEAAADTPSMGGDFAVRLAALDSFEFAGDDATTDECDGLPAADHILDPDGGVQWCEPKVLYWDVVSNATENDLAKGLAKASRANQYATGSPGSSGAHIGSFVDPDWLEELIVELEARGYVVYLRAQDVIDRVSTALGI
jgi:hypothetical protein